MKCVQLLSEFFNQLPGARVTENVDKEDLQRLIALFNISLAMLRIAASLWSYNIDQAFVQMREAVIRFYPKLADSVKLVEIEAYCDKLRLLFEDDPNGYMDTILPNLIRILDAHLPAVDKMPDVSNASLLETNHLYVMPTSADLACQAIFILNSFLLLLSPLNISEVFEDDEFEPVLVDLVE
jgi:hypothetical protein